MATETHTDRPVNLVCFASSFVSLISWKRVFLKHSYVSILKSLFFFYQSTYEEASKLV